MKSKINITKRNLALGLCSVLALSSLSSTVIFPNMLITEVLAQSTKEATVKFDKTSTGITNVYSKSGSTTTYLNGDSDMVEAGKTIYVKLKDESSLSDQKCVLITYYDKRVFEAERVNTEDGTVLFKFTMPEQPVWINLGVYPSKDYTIQNKDTTYISDIIVAGTNGASADKSDNVKVTLSESGLSRIEDGYALAVSYTDSSGEVISQVPIDSSEEYNFTMVGYNISFSLEKLIDITDEQEPTSTKTQSQGIAGENISITKDLSGRYNSSTLVITATTEGDGDSFRATTNNSTIWNFNMPNYPVTLEVKPTYDITYPSNSITSSQSKGYEGETIIVTPITSLGEQDFINVVETSSGDPITVKTNSDGTSSFIMPATSITISIDKIPRALTYNSDEITIISPTVDYQNDTLVSGSKINAGTSIQAEAELKSNQIVLIQPTSSGDFDRLSGSNVSYTFDMPNYDTTLKIVDTYSVTPSNDNIESIEISNTSNLTRAAQYEVVTINLKEPISESKDIFVIGDNSGASSNVTKINDTTYSFVMSSEDITITIDDRISPDKIINFTDTNILAVSYGDSYEYVESSFTKVPQGELVTVIFDKSIGQEVLLVKNSVGTVVNSMVNVNKVTKVDEDDKDTFTFIMPSYDVRLSSGLNDSNSEDSDYDDENVVLLTTDLSINFTLDADGYISKVNVLTGKFNGTLEIKQGFDYYQPIKNEPEVDDSNTQISVISNTELNTELQTKGSFIGFASDVEIIYDTDNPHIEDDDENIELNDVKNLIISQSDFLGDLDLSMFTGLTSLNLAGLTIGEPEDEFDEDGNIIPPEHETPKIILPSNSSLSSIVLPDKFSADEVDFVTDTADGANFDFSNVTFVANTTTSQDALIQMGLSGNYKITLAGLHILSLKSNAPTSFDLATSIDPTKFVDLYAYSPNKNNSDSDKATAGFIKINYDTTEGSTSTFVNTTVPDTKEQVDAGKELNYSGLSIGISNTSNIDEQNRFTTGGYNSLNIFIKGGASGTPLVNKTLTSPLFDIDVTSLEVTLSTNNSTDKSSILSKNEGITVSVNKTNEEKTALSPDHENALTYNWYYANTKSPSSSDYIKVSNNGNVLTFDSDERVKLLDKKYIFCEVYDETTGEVRMGNPIYVDIQLSSSSVTLSSSEDLYDSTIQVSGKTSSVNSTLTFDSSSSTANTKLFDTGQELTLTATHEQSLDEEKEVKWTIVAQDVTGTTTTTILKGDSASFNITPKMSSISIYSEIVDITKYSAMVILSPIAGGTIQYSLNDDTEYSETLSSAEILYLEEGEKIHLKVTEADDYSFLNWAVSGDLEQTSTSKTFSYTIPSLEKDIKISIQPYFEKAQSDTSGGGSSSGSSSSSGGGSYNSSSSSLGSASNNKPTPTPEELLESLAGSTGSVNTTDYSYILSPYTDVKGHWAYNAIGFVMQEGYFNGNSFNTFSPEGMMTRAMVVTTLSRVAQVNTSILQNNDSFKDISSDMWYTGAVSWALENNITRGVSNTEFDPDGPVTREQMAVFFLNFANLIGLEFPLITTELNFKDNEYISFWARDAIIALNTAGVMIGNPDGTFNPQGTATRAEVATMVVRFIDVIK